MNQDQFERLQKLEEKLMEVFLDEADPDQWSGASQKIAVMDKQMRGDRYWCKRNAAATGVLVCKVRDLNAPPGAKGQMAVPGTDTQAEADEMEAELSSYEKQAEALMRQVQSGQKITRGKAKPGSAP